VSEKHQLQFAPHTGEEGHLPAIGLIRQVAKCGYTAKYIHW